MRFKYLISFLLLLSLAFFFSSQKVSAYSTEAHLTLTQEIVKFYNLHFPDKPISDDLKDYLIDGSRREDDPPRWMNHFYDPVYNRGLTAPLLGSWQKSKDWAQDAKNQMSLKYNPVIATLLSLVQTGEIQKFFPTSDFTWQKALKYYLDGNFEMAMFTLGHILHLIEDTAVPDHTRNDSHPEGSPYEIYTKQFTIENLDLSKSLKDKKPVLLNDLNSYFDELANYSNKNFYSKDTIGIQSGYGSPEPDYFRQDGDKVYGFKIDKEFGDYHLIKANGLFAWAFNGNELLNHPFIMSDYWDRLSIKAVQYGASVLNLFFQEGEKAKNNPNLIEASSQSFLAQIAEGISNFFSSLFGSNDNFQPITQIPLNNQTEFSPDQQLPQSKEPISSCSFNTSQFSTRQKVIINEVAWMGGYGSPNDEWIELKNISGNSVDISGWQLIDQKEQIKIIVPPTTKLSANRFYLLERNGDETVPNINADFIYKGSLSNTDEGLRLFDNNCNLIDEVFAQPNWPAGDNNEKRSMERSPDLTWHTYSGSSRNGILGTPKTENSKPIEKPKEDLNKPTDLETQTKNPTSTKISIESNSTSTLSLPLLSSCTFNTSQFPNRQKLIINEIAWMGTTESANNEWIEIKNISGASLNISGWQVVDQGEQIKIIFKEGSVIPANGFYLLERTDDSTVPNITADLIYTGTLSNTNEGLRLFDPQCNLIDEAVANPSWSAGSSNERKTMERDLSGFGWHTSSIVNGTPKRENSLPASGYSSGGGSSSSNNNSSQQENQTPPTICSRENLGPPSHSVLINEVAWAGTSSSTTADEWIELKNNSGQLINLNDWQLLNKDVNIKIFFDTNDTLNSGDFYLLERSDDNSVSGITADKIFTNAIKNSGESLRLFNQSCQLVDEIFAEPSWLAGTASPDYRSAERLSDLSWQTYSGNGNNGIMGTPKAENNQSQNNPQNQSENPTSTIISNVNHIVISEIVAGISGEANNEFVELYNPTDRVIDLSGWALKRKTSRTATTTQNLVSRGSFTGAINSRSFFLIASKTYSGSKTPDLIYSQSSNHLAQSDDVLLLYDAQDNLIDEVSYESVDFGQSLERKAFQNTSCLSAQNNGEFLGNGCDNDNDSDFEIRLLPNPQNSSNLPEPRSAPTAVQNFNIQYHSSVPTLFFYWEQSTTTTGNSLIYEIRERISSSIFVATTTALEFSKNIDEVSRDYNFTIQAFDQDGLGSPVVSTDVAVPSFINSLYFYSNSSTTPSQYFLEFSYNNYPFIPGFFNGGGDGSWRVLVFYYNREAPKNLYLDESWGGNLVDSGALKIIYPHCAGADARRTGLVLPDTSNRCSANYGGVRNSSLRWDQLEDHHLLIDIDPSNFTSVPTPQDYIATAFYAYEGFNSQRLAAIDARKYYFQDFKPINQPPTAPTNLSTDYNPETSILTLSWGPSTDADNLDNLLTYEVNISGSATSSTLALDENSWSVANLVWGSDPQRKYTQLPVSPQTSYLTGLRAKDPSGNISGIALLNFETPVTPPPFGISNIRWGHINNPEAVELTFEFDNYPFIPDGGWPWSAIVFYLNQDPPNEYRFEVGTSPFSNVASSFSRLSLSYQGCSEPARDSGGLILPRYSDAPCYSWGGLRAAALQYSQIQMPSEGQKGKITINVNGEFSSNDYLTIGFYASGNYSKEFELVGVDKNKYYFEP